MNRLQLKKRVIELLRGDSLAFLKEQLQALPETGLLNALFSCLCHPEEAVRWHAVSGFGFVVPVIAEDDMEQARTIMRRFLWMLNDESGGIGWGVPEAMAEVMYYSRPLGREYLHMLVSYTKDDGPELFQDGNFLELDLMQEAVLWGLCRVAPVYPEALAEHNLDANLDVYFRSSNPAVRGLVCRLAGELKLPGRRDDLLAARNDGRALKFYEQGEFICSTVAELARAALQEISV